MFSTFDLNSLFDPPPGSVETSTISFFEALDGSVSMAGPLIGGVSVGEAGGGDGAGVGVGLGVGLAMISGRLCNSRVSRWSIPPVGPRTTVVSFTNPTPGKNQRSMEAAIRD